MVPTTISQSTKDIWIMLYKMIMIIIFRLQTVYNSNWNKIDWILDCHTCLLWLWLYINNLPVNSEGVHLTELIKHMGRIIWHHFLRIMIISHSECPFNVLLMPCEWPLAAASVPPLLSALFEVPNSAVNDTFVTAALWFGSIRGQTLEWQLGQKTGRNRNWCDDYLWTSLECEEEGMTLG